MKVMKKLLMMALIGAIVSAAPAWAKELKKFNAGYLASPGHVLYFVAKEKGFFEEEGLDVELFLFNNSGEGMNAIMAGKLDAGTFGSTAPLKFIANGSPFTLFGGQMENGGSGLVTKPERVKEFQNLKNFRGKKIGTVRLSTADVVFRAALLREGVDWKKDMTLLELESPGAVLEAVKKGTVDAGMVWSPHLVNCEKMGLKTALYTDTVEKDHSCCRQAALTSRLSERSDDYVHFLRALIKAYRFYQTKKEETVDIIEKYVKVDKDVLMEETYGGHCVSHPDPGKKGSIHFWENMRKVGYIDPGTKVDITKHLNTELYKKALDSIVKETPKDPIYQRLAKEYPLRNI